jgi:ribosomal-protein-alanine N-acetyltransferase
VNGPDPSGPDPSGPDPSGTAGFRLRLMEKDDLPTVLAMERAVFPDDAWTEEMLAAELAGQGDTHYYVVAVEEAPDKAGIVAGASERGAERGRAPGSTEAPDKASGGKRGAEGEGAPESLPDTSVVGYAGLFAPGGSQGDVQTIAVRADRQGRGIGAALLSALISEAAARGCREVFLDVRAGNAVARRLYRRAGFTDIGVRRGYYQPSGADAIVMRLKLPQPRHGTARRAGTPEHGARNDGGRDD